MYNFDVWGKEEIQRKIKAYYNLAQDGKEGLINPLYSKSPTVFWTHLWRQASRYLNGTKSFNFEDKTTRMELFENSSNQIKN